MSRLARHFLPTGSVLDLEEIVQAGLCIGCGLCQSIAGAERVRLIATRDGRERPVALRSLDHATLEAIDAVCPGVRVGAIERSRLAPGTPTDPIWGPIARIAIAHASDPEIRFRGASGGVLTALAELLLRRAEVQFILHVAPLANRPLRSGRQVSLSRRALLQAAGSRYGPAAALIDLCRLLDRGETFAVVGKPCDISALRNLAHRDPRVDAQMRYALAMVCGGASELTKSSEVLEGLGIAEAELKLFRYRGHGNPGSVRVETLDGRAHELSYMDMWADESRWRTQPRCRICPDALGEAADIVAADCWDGGFPSSENDGFNAVIVRTSRGSELFEAALSEGALTVVRDITPRDMDRFQPHQIAKKRALWPRLLGLRLAGHPAPRARRLRLRRLALATSPRAFVAEALGARRRARSDRLTERSPLPEGPTLTDSWVQPDP